MQGKETVPVKGQCKLTSAIVKTSSMAQLILKKKKKTVHARSQNELVTASAKTSIVTHNLKKRKKIGLPRSQSMLEITAKKGTKIGPPRSQSMLEITVKKTWDHPDVLAQKVISVKDVLLKSEGETIYQERGKAQLALLRLLS